MKTLLFAFIICLFLFACQQTEKEKLSKPNILFIAVDDLRPELGCYGNQQIKSPNIDKLAGEGLVFNRTYCQQAICMASRASIMSGLRPNTSQIYNCESLEQDAPGILTLDQHFENNGYEIWASGKIYHHGIDREKQFGESYIKVNTEEQGRGYLDEESIEIVKEYNNWYSKNRNEKGGGRGPAFESPEVPDNAYHDGKMTDMAIDKLAELKKGDKPFFMAVGYKKPHLPFNAPKKYWDLYDADEIEKADNMFMPKNVSEYFNYNFGELRNYAGIPKGGTAFSEDLNKNLKHGYYACVSYTDAQIGRLLEGLKENGLDENTIVILWGDHGWNLGDHKMWCKHCNFESSLHVPMIVKAPGKTSGQKTNAITEYVDIYPSLCDLAGLPIPDHLNGESFVPLMEGKSMKKDYAIAKYFDGVTLVKGNLFYTEYIDKEGNLKARMLFDHSNDPLELDNLAEKPDYQNKVKELSDFLRANWGEDFFLNRKINS